MSVRNSKALIGALFIQYCAYSVFYILDEFKKISPSHYKHIEAEEQKRNEPIQEEEENKEDDFDNPSVPKNKKNGPVQRGGRVKQLFT